MVRELQPHLDVACSVEELLAGLVLGAVGGAVAAAAFWFFVLSLLTRFIGEGSVAVEELWRWVDRSGLLRWLLLFSGAPWRRFTMASFKRRFSRALLLAGLARSGRRGGGGWAAAAEDGVPLFWLFLDVILCGSCCWLWLAMLIRPRVGIGASPPPICHDCPDPGVRVGWSLRRLQRGVLLYRFLLATQLLLAFFVFDSGVSSVVLNMAAAADFPIQRRSQGPSCVFLVIKGFSCNLGTAVLFLDISFFVVFLA